MEGGAVKEERKMEERKEGAAGTGMLERLQKLYAEREEEYRKREQAFAERGKIFETQERQLKKWAESLKKKQEIIEGREKNCGTRTDALAKREKEAEEKEKCLAREESRLATLEAGLKETAGQKIMEAQILVEEARNEKLKEQRLREEQEARLAEIGGGEDGIPPVVLSECGIGEEIRLLKEEHGEEIMLLRKKHEEETKMLQQKYGEELKAKEETIAELKAAMDGLEKEKAGLFRKLLSLPDAEDVPKSGTVENETQDVPESGTQEGKEELTAEVLFKYLLKNGEGKTPELFHADAGDQVRLKEEGRTFVFAFEKPPYFDIRIKRKDGRSLKGGRGRKGMLSEYGKRYPGVEFTYDQAAREVVASGYFTQEMDASGFLEKVRKVAACLDREEG